eukprot:8799998-Alexandrium_andersonii.AAC.1
MVVQADRFCQSREERVTYRAPVVNEGPEQGGEGFAGWNFVLTPKRWANMVRRYRVGHRASSNSDHFPILTDM